MNADPIVVIRWEGNAGHHSGTRLIRCERRQTSSGRRRQARLTLAMFWIVVGLIGVARLRLHQRFPRRGELHLPRSCRRAILSPGKAVAWAAFFNFVAAFVFGTAVAKTVGLGMIDIKIVTFAVFAG